ncbi:MAG: hydantoin utilization protein A [Myxococcota bacterium]
MWTIFAGAVAGAAHVVSGPDHLAALAPLALKSPRRAVRVGALWGLGHGMSVLALGVVGQLFRGLVDIEAFSMWSETAVGFLLIVIGLWAFRSAARLHVHVHHHHHDGDTHQHIHVHVDEPQHRDESHDNHGHAALWVGALHGAAGSGHLLGVLPSLALGPVMAAVYLTAYLIAAIAAMSTFSLGIAFAARRGGPRMIPTIMRATALAAVVVGVAWIGRSVMIAGA